MKKVFVVMMLSVMGLNAFAQMTDAEAQYEAMSACKAISADVELGAEMRFKEQTGVSYDSIASIESREVRENLEDTFQTILDQVAEENKVELNKACQ